MKLKDIGEFNFIERFAERCSTNLPNGFVGIGDDCATISCGGQDVLVSTDMLVEGVHFLLDKITPQELGAKSVAVNVSDLASSGAKPCGVFLSLAIPAQTEVDWLDEFMDGFISAAEHYGCPLLGGDTNRSLGGLVVNVTVVGKTAKGMYKTRSEAKIGDTICVTGSLGDSAAGLEIILKNMDCNSDMQYLVNKHKNPIARLKEGMMLACREEVHSMMDISDGLASDLVHILKKSSVAANIYVEKIPISKQLEKVFGTDFSKTYRFATSGGEDYELLLTVDCKKFASLSKDFELQFGHPLYSIGKIVEGQAYIRWFEYTEPVSSFGNGFDHFSVS